MNILLNLFYIITFIVVTVGALGLLYYPLALIAELRSNQHPPVFDDPYPLVSVIVPAYNEEKVIENCVESILTCGYEKMEIKLVDDGSTDRTLELMRKYEDHPMVHVISQVNNGKASALNRGFQNAKGEILFFVDADGIFTPSTIPEMLKAFTSEKVGAVCGNDYPVNLNTPLTKLFCLQTHVGTGFVRRALAEINCLPIVSGNCGAFRRTALSWPFLGLGKKAEPYLKGFIGEDLELTWRIHKAGYRVKFAPHAIVRAEVPSTISMLWKQRVRWARGLLQTVVLHKEMFFNFKYGTLGLYLPINFFNMVVIPILQLLILLLLIIFIITGFSPIQLSILNLLLWLGLGGSLLTVLYATALDRAWRDLRFFYVIPLWIPYSLLMNIVVIWAIVLEIQGKEAKWNKFERTGVVTNESNARVEPSKGQAESSLHLQSKAGELDPVGVDSEYARIAAALSDDPTGLRYDSNMKQKEPGQAGVLPWDAVFIDEFMEDQIGSSETAQMEMNLPDEVDIISSDVTKMDESSEHQTGSGEASPVMGNKLEWKVVASTDSGNKAKPSKERTELNKDLQKKLKKLEWIPAVSKDSKLKDEPSDDQAGFRKDL